MLLKEDRERLFLCKSRRELFGQVLERWANDKCPLRATPLDEDLRRKLTSGEAARPWPDSKDLTKGPRHSFYFRFIVSCVGDKAPYSLPACWGCEVGYWSPVVTNVESI